MKFWDASALVPLISHEESSRAQEQILRTDSDSTVWWGTRIECRSAITRKIREGLIMASQLPGVEELLSLLFTPADEVGPTENLRLRAARLLNVHALRVADALQLAAALS